MESTSGFNDVSYLNERLPSGVRASISGTHWGQASQAINTDDPHAPLGNKTEPSLGVHNHFFQDHEQQILRKKAERMNKLDLSRGILAQWRIASNSEKEFVHVVDFMERQPNNSIGPFTGEDPLTHSENIKRLYLALGEDGTDLVIRTFR